MKNNNHKNSSKLNFLNNILYVAIALLVVLIGIYIFFILGTDNNTKSNWGTFGDFLGGTLNPIFGLFSLFAIIYTIKIQTEELELSRQELEDTKKELHQSRIAQQEQSKSLQLQNVATKLQIFENTFFTLIKEVNSLADNFLEQNDKRRELNYFRDFGIFNDKLIKKFYARNNGIMKTYFIMLYQILRFVDDAEIDNKKKYTNIIRANLEGDVLYLLALNCKVNKYEKYIHYIEKYSLLEHLDFHNDDFIKFNFIIENYDLKAFGKNIDILNYLNNKEDAVLKRISEVTY